MAHDADSRVLWALAAANRQVWAKGLAPEEFVVSASRAQVVSKRNMLLHLLDNDIGFRPENQLLRITYLASWWGYGPHVLGSIADHITCVDLSLRHTRNCEEILTQYADNFKFSLHPDDDAVPNRMRFTAVRADAREWLFDEVGTHGTHMLVNTSVEHFTQEENLAILDQARRAGVKWFYLQSTNMPDNEHVLLHENAEDMVSGLRLQDSQTWSWDLGHDQYKRHAVLGDFVESR